MLFRSEALAFKGANGHKLKSRVYRSLYEIDGLPCVACPQGKWSKNWELREAGECTNCPTGTVCSVDGMTVPCSKSDLPTPFEPVVNLDGVAVAEYLYPSYDQQPAVSSFECLKMNPGWVDGSLDVFYQIFYYGEVVPPYVDVLGRGARFRASDQESLKYQSHAKCYRNTQRYGSMLYQRMADYYGPQYDIQVGHPHQGYGASVYDGFFGKGSLYIDLPHARVFDAAFNCTKGFQLMNETLHPNSDFSVYTDPEHDPEGEQRDIALGEDQFYPGTCEADLFCDSEETVEAEACAEGYVCDESTNSETSIFYTCREGYVCDFGTTPDPDLESKMGQYHQLCPAGYVCMDGTGLGQAKRTQCPADMFCPTGTADPSVGAVADDALNRGLAHGDADPFEGISHLKYLADDDVRLISDHDKRCFDGIDPDLKARHRIRWLPDSTVPRSEEHTSELQSP